MDGDTGIILGWFAVGIVAVMVASVLWVAIEWIHERLTQND